MATQAHAINGTLLRLWETYAPIYAASFGKISVSKKFTKELRGYLLPVPGGKVLDAGCGPGLQFEMIIRATNPSQLIGLDVSPKMVGEANRAKKRLDQKYRCQIDLKEADLCKGIPFPDNALDVQVYHLVLYYLPAGEWKNVLKEAFRVAKTGGYVISSHALGRFDFKKEVGIVPIIKDMLLHPRAVYLSLTELKPILHAFQNLEERGLLKYPSKEELVEVHKSLGFVNVVCKNIWKDNMVMIRAHKPE